MGRRRGVLGVLRAACGGRVDWGVEGGLRGGWVGEGRFGGVGG